jgi:hypothetical protein
MPLANAVTSQENGSLVVPGGDRCPFCISNADPHPIFTRLKEVLPLNSMLEVISQKRQELDACENQGLRVCPPTEEGIHKNTTEEHKDTRCGDLLYPSPLCSPPLESGLIPVNPPGLIPVNPDDSSSSIGSSVGFGRPVQGMQVSVLEFHFRGGVSAESNKQDKSVESVKSGERFSDF